MWEFILLRVRWRVTFIVLVGGGIFAVGYSDYQDFVNHRGHYAPEIRAEYDAQRAELKMHEMKQNYETCKWWRETKMDWGFLPGPYCH
jgi:hypothetical protein